MSMIDDHFGVWIDCYACGGGGVDENSCTCIDDCCCCLEPEYPTCDICRGAGGWMCTPEEAERATT